MPRPPLKRKRSNPPAFSQRFANNPSSSPRLHLEQKLASKPLGTKPQDSDDSDKLVTSAPNKRNRKNIGRKEVYASGGVAVGDTPGSHPSQKGPQRVTQANQTRALQNPTSKASTQREEPKDKTTIAKPALQDPALAATATLHSLPSAPALLPSPIAPPTFATTPNAGASILGTLKPRRRQPSILAAVDNHGSSSLDLEDADFLPDAESTPLNLSKSAAAISTPISSPSQHANPRKRRISSLVPSMSNSEARPDVLVGSPERAAQAHQNLLSSPSLPTPLLSARTQAKHSKQQRENSAEEQVMAPPESSSSPVPSSARQTDPSPAHHKTSRKAQLAKAMTTEALQGLMPRRAKTRPKRAQPISEFDIPMDSDEAQSHIPDDDEESFIPAGRAKKAKASTRNTRTKGRNQKAISTLSPTVNTPQSRPVRKKSTKSPSQPLSTHVSGVVIADEVSTYSSHRQPRSRFANGGDKENTRNISSGPSLNLVEESNGHGSSDVEEDLQSGTMQTLKVKFAEIDKWDMEFEEVDVSSHSSDPFMR